MAWAHIQGHHATDAGTSGTYTVAGSAVGSGNTVVGYFTIGSPNVTDILSITDNQSNTYTIVSKTSDGPKNQSFCLFYCINITNAPTTLTFNYTNGISAVFAMWDEFSGSTSTSAIDGTASRVQVSPGTGTDAVSTGSTFGNSGDLIYGVTLDDGFATTISIGTGFTLAQNDNADGSFFGLSIVSEFKTASGASDVTFTIAATGDMDTAGLAITPGAAVVPFGWSQINNDNYNRGIQQILAY